jgi:hypothetical protein
MKIPKLRAALTPVLTPVLTLALAALVLVGAPACKKDKDKPNDSTDEPGLLAEDGTDANIAETDTEVVTSSLISAATSSGSLSLASTGELDADGIGTREIGDGAKALYFPRGCLTVTNVAPTLAEPGKVTYVFNACAGPNGIFRINGTIVATYRARSGVLVLDITGNELRVNRAVVDWSAHAEVTANGTAREMKWKGQLAGVTARGKEFSRTNDKIITWRTDERCFGLSGVSEGNVRGRSLRTEIANFRRCQGACPEAGGTIKITNLDANLSIEIAFDGTNRATYTGPRGTTTFALACER